LKVCPGIWAAGILCCTMGLQAAADDSLSVSHKPQFRWWGECYDESIFFERHGNMLYSNSHIRQGVKISRLPYIHQLECYTMVRYGRDIHRDLWNTKKETGLGIRLRFFRKLFIAPYVEIIRGYYGPVSQGFPEPEEKQYSDVRGGLLFWYGWDRYDEPDRTVTFPLHAVGEVYSELDYFRMDDHNVILYLHTRAGLRAARIWTCALTAYGVLYFLRDINQDFWNNTAEFGPGIWIKPHPSLDLKIFVEWLQGYYFNVESRDKNPYDDRYTDRRIGVLFWVGW